MAVVDINPIDQLNIIHNHRVLDLGCGDGAHLKHAQVFSPIQLIALDIDASNLHRLFSPKKKLTATPVCADALNLPFPDESFDRVICSLVFYLLPFQDALFELNRVIKPRGRVYIRLPLLSVRRDIHILILMFSKPRVALYHLLLTLNGLWYALSGSQLWNPFLRNDHWAFYVPRARFEQALATAGFVLEQFEIDRPTPGTKAMDAWLRKI